MLAFAPWMTVLTEEERRTVMADFRRARQYVLYVLTVKLSFWRQLPWILMGLGHYCPHTAQGCARRGLALARSAGAHVKHHVVVLMLCIPGGSLYVEFIDFSGGVRALQDLPGLLVFAAKARFVRVVERWIEARHAIMHMLHLTARHRSGTHMAFVGTLPALRDYLVDLRMSCSSWQLIAPTHVHHGERWGKWASLATLPCNAYSRRPTSAPLLLTGVTENRSWKSFTILTQTPSSVRSPM